MGDAVTTTDAHAPARNPRRMPRTLTIAAVVAVLAVVSPVIITVSQAATSGWHVIRSDLGRWNVLVLLAHTVLVAVIAAPVCAAVGTAAAWYVERTRLAGRRVWALLMVAPITVPAFVTSYAWVTLSSSMQGYLGAVVITSVTYYPLVFLMVSVSLRQMDPALEESARSLGCSPWRVFSRVVLPQLRPALLGATLLVALDALVEYDAFSALKFQTFSTDVFAQYQAGLAGSGAAILSCVSVVLCIAFLVVESRLRGGANYARVAQGTRRPPARYSLGREQPFVIGGFAVVAAVSLGVPLGTLGYWFSQSSSRALSEAAAGMRYLLPATATSVALALGSAALAAVLALPVALLATRCRGRWVTLIERASWLSYAMPDLVGAIALAYAASHFVHFLYGSVLLLVFAYSILFVPLAIVAMRTTLGQIDRPMEESARSLGVGGLATLWRVTFPLARPGLAAACVLVFAFVIGDLSTTQVLLPPGMYTLGTQFNSNAVTVAFAAAAPYAAVIIGLSFVATYILMSRFGRTRLTTGTVGGVHP